MERKDSIRYMRNEEIDTKRWDACIKQAVNGSLYGYSWYLNLVCHWDALVQGDYESVFPLPYRVKAGLSYIYMPPFTQQLGLFSTKLIEPDILHDFLEAIPAHFKLIELNLNTLNKVEDEKLLSQVNRNYELDLIVGKERIQEGYSTNLKRNLQKASKAGLDLTPNISPTEIIALFRANRGNTIKTLGSTDYRILERLIHGMLHKGIVRIMGATGGPNTLLAAVVMVELSERTILLFTATERREANFNALAWLIDKYIEEVAGHPRVLDFEGSNDPQLGRFYASFGARETTYPSICIDRLSAWQHTTLKIIRSFRRFI